MAKMSDAQFGALLTLKEQGSISAIEVLGPLGMDGKRKASLECNVMNIATLKRLVAEDWVTVSRTPIPRPRSAVGKHGKPRTRLDIKPTEKGLSALAAEMAS